MVHHADHHLGVDVVLRANQTVLLTLLWSALVGCVVSSVAFDVGHWFGAW